MFSITVMRGEPPAVHEHLTEKCLIWGICDETSYLSQEM